MPIDSKEFLKRYNERIRYEQRREEFRITDYLDRIHPMTPVRQPTPVVPQTFPAMPKPKPEIIPEISHNPIELIELE